MSELRVRFSDAASDVLTYLANADTPGWRTLNEIVEDVAPTDADRPRLTIASVLDLLRRSGYVEQAAPHWRVSTDGRAAVAKARPMTRPLVLDQLRHLIAHARDQHMHEIAGYLTEVMQRAEGRIGQGEGR